MAKRIEMNIKESDSSYEVLWPEDGRYTDEQILSDEVKTFWGLEPDAIPSDAFMAIAGVFDKTVNFTVTIDGAPAEGVTIEGFNGTAGSVELVTNSEGKCTGITTDNTINITAKSPWIDAEDVQYNQTLGGIISNVNIVMTSQSSGRLEYTSSGTVRFSPSRKQVSYCVIGGGASGSAGVSLQWDTYYGYNEYYGCAFGGSGGGELKTGTFSNDTKDITFVVGSGGASNNVTYAGWKTTEGTNGGQSKITLSDETSILADSGQRGNIADQGSTKQYFDSVSAYGGKGGSGGGGVAYDRQSSFSSVGNGGTNGTNGTGETRFGSSMGGQGQGTSTTYEDTTYCRGCGGILFQFQAYENGGGFISSQSAGNYSLCGANITKGNDGILYGDAGGNAVGHFIGHESHTVTAGAGKQGVVIFKWTS